MLRFGTAALLVLAGTAFAKEEPPVVSVATVKTVQASVEKTYIGHIISNQEVNIVPRVTGILKKIYFADGAVVKKGDLLVEIEDTTYLAKVKSCEAQLLRAKAHKEYASKEYERNKTLKDKDAVAVANFDSADRENKEADAEVLEAEAALLDARNDLSYTKIYAPLSGKIGKIQLDAGNLLKANVDTLYCITEISPVQVCFAVSERVFLHDLKGSEGFEKNAIVRVRLADGSIYPEKGTLLCVDNKVNTQTNTIRIWLVFENKDGKLISGGLATVLLSVKNPGNLCAVPQESIVTENIGTFVYVLDKDNMPVKRKVTLGSTAENYQEVTSGLYAGETVVVQGIHKIIPGKPVQVK